MLPACHPDADEGRGRGLHLTPKGQGMIKEGYPVWQEAQARAATLMGADCR